MKIEVVEEEDEKLKVMVHTNLTLINLLNDKIWKQRVDASAYRMEGLYPSLPLLMVKGKNPRKSIIDAAEEISEEIKDFRKHFAAAMK